MKTLDAETMESLPNIILDAVKTRFIEQVKTLIVKSLEPEIEKTAESIFREMQPEIQAWVDAGSHGFIVKMLTNKRETTE
jgi:hypothetical protein